MGELGLNKIFGSILAAALGIMGLQTISSMVFSSGGHHGHHGEEKPYCETVKENNAYYVSVPCDGESVVEEGPVYDLGMMMLSAEAEKGERVFKSVCSSCHTINQGGADGTGPNLYGIINRDIASTPGFGYSAALSGVEGNWTYEQIDHWIEDPANIARGVNMVANVKRDSDRANLIAYLAANTPNPPPFPEPMPEEPEAEEASLEGLEPGEAAETPATATGEIETLDAVDGEAPNTGEAGEVELGAPELDVVEEAVAEGEAAVEEIVEDATEAVDDAEIPAAPEPEGEDPAEEVSEPN